MIEKLKLFLDDVKNNPDNYGKYVHLAVERFYNDLKNSKENKWDYIFDEAKAQRVISFVELLKQSKGDWARRNLILEPWQVFIFANIFGWVNKFTGYRRFKQIYISVAKKNGKSTLISALAIYGLLADNEEEAEIYVGANANHQADIIFKQVKNTLGLTKGLNKRVVIQTAAIVNPKNRSSIKKISSEAKSLDGLNAHIAILDEIHEFRNGDVWNLMRGALSSRKQPLLIGITTAGLSKDHFGFEQEDATRLVLENIHDDPKYFGIIFSIDKPEEAHIEKSWIKANPNLGVSITLDELQDLYRDSKLSTSKMNTFIAKRTNIYTDNRGAWIDLSIWKECIVDTKSEDELKDQLCFVGVDLSQSHDFSAVSYTFPFLNNYTKWDFYLPSNGLEERNEFENVNYQKWINKKYIKITEGRAIDHGIIRDDILANSKNYNIIELCYDPNLANRLVPDLIDENVNCVLFRQNPTQMAPATSIMDLALKNGTVSIEDNPVFLWMANNAVAKSDGIGNSHIVKTSNRRKRVDGVIAIIMSHYRAYYFNSVPEEKSKEIKEIMFI